MTPLELEQKWQKYWKENNIAAFDETDLEHKYYLLQMFIYPSAARMHMGHYFNYGLADSYARFKKMCGANLFQPMGFDSFGLPSENYALKTNTHPQANTAENIKNIEAQYNSMGALYDWNYKLTTSEPDYYKWTQWVFLELFKAGLAYQKEAAVNFCPKCHTVLANEQVVDGACERCESAVEQKYMKQWFFKTTAYAEQLLNGLDTIDWPENTKLLQRNWIGKSQGSAIWFKCGNETIEVFTTRADTLFGVSYIVLAPEHGLVPKITIPAQKSAVNDYIKQAGLKKEIERSSATEEKTGVFTGAYAVHPLTQKEVPVWIADYCIASYGTGAVMGVPAHDERDYKFAQKYKLPVNRVVVVNKPNEDLPTTEYGKLVNSRDFDGLTSDEAKLAITTELAKTGAGELKTTYRLRDWSVSRQRYWGCPIPVIHCPHCGVVPVPEEQLPVKLPMDVDFKPDGTPPLAKSADFVNCICPKCNKPAKREVETLDTFVCSSWYFLRYPSVGRNDVPFDKEITKRMLPVDICIGGREHACMHLIFARFMTMALYDLGYLNFKEPFKRLVHQGMILGPDGQKMSKRFGNVVNPDDYTSKYGSDAIRFALAFGFNFTMGGPWSDTLIAVAQRFFDKITKLCGKYGSVIASPTSEANKRSNPSASSHTPSPTAPPLYLKGEFSVVYGKLEKDLEFTLNDSIKRARDDIEVFSFNTALARYMELINAIGKYEKEAKEINYKLVRQCVTSLVLGVAPFAPHHAEEWWSMLGNITSIFKASYPGADYSKLVQDTVNIAIQVNSKIIVTIDVPTNAAEEEVFALAEATDKIKAAISGRTIVKKIYVKGRIVNLIVK